MINVLMHRRSRIASLVNPDLKQLFHFQYNGGGWYYGPDIMSYYMGTAPIYADWGDGTSGLMATGRDYPDGSTKTISLYSSEGLWGLVKARFSWQSTVGKLPRFHHMPNLKYIEADNCSFTDTLPSFAENPLLEEISIFSGPVITGALPDFSTNIHLVTLNLDNQFISGTIPDMSACTALVTFYLGSGSHTTTGYVHGGFNTQPNLGMIGFWNHFWPQSEVDSLLHELVTYSLGLGGRVACEVQLHGSNMAAPNAQGYADAATLTAAGWTVYTE